MGILDKAKREILYRKNINVLREKLGEKVVNLIESQGSKVKVVSKGKKLDVLINSHSVYGGDANALVELQIEKFVKNPTQIFRSILFDFNKLSMPGEIAIGYRKRLFRDLTNEEYLKVFESKIDLSHGYIPLLLIQGVGLGIHIERLLKDYFVHNLVIVDLPKFFKPSLYYLDWEDVFNYFSSEDRQLHIVFLPENYPEKHPNIYLHPVVNAIGGMSPALILYSLFFQHLNYSPPIDICNWITSSGIYAFSFTGFFDDELWSVEWTLEKIRRKIPVLSKTNVVNSDASAIIIGAGPSLDKNLDFLRKVKDSAVLISCGSAITALEKVDIKPDIHVELERTKITYDCLNEVNKDFLKGVFLITTNPVWTECFDLFQNGGILIKEYDAGAELFDDKNLPSTLNSGITVASLAVSVGILLGFKDIYLLGVDLGSKLPEIHHSQKTNYYNPESFMSKLSTGFDMLVPGNFGGNVHTNIYFWLTAQSISYNAYIYKDVSIFNLSDGIYIAGTTPLRPDALELDKSTSKTSILSSIFSAFTTDYQVNLGLWQEQVEKLFAELYSYLSKHQVRDLKELIDGLVYIEKIFHQYNKVKSMFLGDIRAAQVMVLGTVLGGDAPPSEVWNRFKINTLKYLDACKSAIEEVILRNT